jgi:uncharacterized protein (TIGR03086 family)
MLSSADKDVAKGRNGDRVEEPPIFVLADRTLNQVVGQIGDDQWGLAMPLEFQRRGSDQVPTLAEIIGYHAFDDAWVPDMLAGRTMDEVGKEAFSGDLLGEDPAAGFAALVDKACQAALAVTDLDRTVHCSFGDYPTREYFWQITLFRGLRAYDLAKLLGLSLTLPDELVQGIWDQVSPHAEEWRSYGVFPPAVAVPEDAPLLDRLLGLTGRQPR